MHGTRAVQSLVEHLVNHFDSFEDEVAQIVKVLEKDVFYLMQHAHANHVI